MSDWFSMDVGDMDGLADRMEQYGAGAGRIVDGVLQGEGAQLIKNNIAMILPESGRTWRKKGRSAKAAMPAAFAQDNAPLSVTIAARNKYHYLYFPDDGSNTRRHAGNQQFMQRGAEEAAQDIVDLCINRLTEEF